MRIRINIDYELSPRVKRALKVGVPAAIILAGSVVYANVPNTFKDGDTLSAQTMNDNFTALDTRLAKIEAFATKASADGGYSIGAMYCGASGQATVGDLSGLTSVTGNGFVKARNQCQVTCSAPGAHMCTSEEVVRSAQLGVAMAAGWYTTGTYGEDTAQSNHECNGWTSKATTDLGPNWQTTSPLAATDTHCDSTLPVMCCN